MALNGSGATSRGSVIDERKLREVFVDAPARIRVHNRPTESAGEQLLDVMRALKMWLAVFALGALVELVSFLRSEPHDPSGIGAIIVLATMAAGLVFVTYVRKQNSAFRAFYAEYAHARGLSIEYDAPLSGRVPVLSAGDERRCAQLFRGRVGALDGTLANYTYWNVIKDFRGSETRLAHDFTVLVVQLPLDVARRYRAVHLSRQRELDPPGFVTNRRVRFESVAFERRYDLNVTNTQDDVALYELFSTTLIDALATGPIVTWQQMSDQLVFYRPLHCRTTDELDEFVVGAQVVIQRYLEEWQ